MMPCASTCDSPFRYAVTVTSVSGSPGLSRASSSRLKSPAQISTANLMRKVVGTFDRLLHLDLRRLVGERVIRLAVDRDLVANVSQNSSLLTCRPRNLEPLDFLESVRQQHTIQFSDPPVAERIGEQRVGQMVEPLTLLA